MPDIPSAYLIVIVAVVVIFGLFLKLCLRIARPWERAIVLRLGNMQGVKGPGPFLLLPFFDRVTRMVDTRITSIPVRTEKTLTRDTTPVTVEAVVFWMVHDPERATVEIGNYEQAVELVAQTSLREAIAAADLTQLLAEREAVDAKLLTNIARKTLDWGVTIKSVEIRDVVLPDTLQNAMSAQAQAYREKDARVTRASAEVAVAEEFKKSAAVYDSCPTAFRILAINRLYDMTKERGTIILMPTEMVNSAGSGAALVKALGAAPTETPPA